MPAKRRVHYPCIICDTACGVDTIQCSTCIGWVHRKCCNMSFQTFADFGGWGVEFECPRCFGRRDNGSFAWVVPLNQLRDTPTIGTVRRLRILLNLYKAQPVKLASASTPPGLEDATSVAILKQFQPQLLTTLTPRSTYGDGNCFYRLTFNMFKLKF